MILGIRRIRSVRAASALVASLKVNAAMKAVACLRMAAVSLWQAFSPRGFLA